MHSDVGGVSRMSEPGSDRRFRYSVPSAYEQFLSGRTVDFGVATRAGGV